MGKLCMDTKKAFHKIKDQKKKIDFIKEYQKKNNKNNPTQK